MNIYVSNLGNKITEESLNAIFSTYGEVSSAKIMIDGFTGLPRGFAFVDMPDESEAHNAIAKLNGSVINGQTLQAQPAQPSIEHKGSYAIGHRSKK